MSPIIKWATDDMSAGLSTGASAWPSFDMEHFYGRRRVRQRGLNSFRSVQAAIDAEKLKEKRLQDRKPDVR